MMNELLAKLSSQGADLIKTVDISMLSEKENRGYKVAVLVGTLLSPGFIYHFTKENIADLTEFFEKEHRTDMLAEKLADLIIAKGYQAFAQSERNLIDNYFDKATKTTPLPHKKVAILAGMGWIGKNNLLVTREYGSALCMCTILTDAPLPVENRPITKPECGSCTVCRDLCPTGVIHGVSWDPGMDRDLIVDVYHCVGCLKCLLYCPWTQKYMNNNTNK